jgi:hypothetical protein
MGGASAGFTSDPSIYRSPATAWPGEIEYPSASPLSGVMVEPPTGTIYVDPSASPPSGAVLAPSAGTVYVAPPATGVVVTPPPGGVVVAPPGTVVVPARPVRVVPTTPLMCPGINAADPRPC